MILPMQSLSPVFRVPANSARFFDDYNEAVAENLGEIHLIWDVDNEIVVNEKFSPDLVRYDSKYCTLVSSIGSNYKIPTLDYIDKVLEFTTEKPVVIDIGCGQGEFVFALRDKGFNAFGFDPVVRSRSPYLQRKYWDSLDLIGDLYVMRCVLPHIQNPWKFLEQISISAPKALVLIEFQRLEWILEHRIWYQISHDHVNLFSISDFVKRYTVVDSGTFAEGEWGWVLIDPSDCIKTQASFPESYASSFAELFLNKEKFLNCLAKSEPPIAIWGAAGKGVVLAHALLALRGEFLAIDADLHRWGYFLEASGSKVLSPGEAVENLASDTLILVCDPNHIEEIKKYVQGKFEVRLPREIVLDNW